MLIMTAADLVAKAKQIEKLPTQYVYGTYGQRMTAEQRGVMANPLR